MNKLHTRQTVHRTLLRKIANQSDFANNSRTGLDNLMVATNAELTPAFELYPNEPADLVLNVGANFVTNPQTSIRHTNPAINKQFPNFTSGTITLPASSGGVITVSPTIVTNPTLTISANAFIKGLIECDSLGNLSITLGSEGATEALAGNPGINTRAYQIGMLVIQTVSGVVQNVTGERIIQFQGGGGSGGSGNVNEEIINLRSTHSESPYIFLASSIFAADETDFVNDVNTTASFSVADSLYELDPGEVLYLDDLLDSSYDSSLHVLKDVAVVIFFKGTPNIGGTAQVSLDGGANWQTITLEQNNDVNQLYGEVTFTTIPVSPDIRFRFTASAACKITGVGVLYGNEYGAVLPPLQERIVGSLAEVNAGIALFTQISDAIASLGSGGGKIRLLSGTFVENLTINSNNVLIEGSGWSSKIQGNVIINGDYNILSKLTVEGNIENNGDNNEFDIIWVV